MRSEQQILKKMDELGSRVSMLEKKYQAQLALPQSQRDRQLMKFLLEEQAIYGFVLEQLGWVLEAE